MRRSILFLSVLLCVLSTVVLASPAGSYVGKWIGGNAEGVIKISLSQPEKGEWKAEVSFTYADADIKCKTVSVKVEGDKLDLVYDFEIAGMQAESTVTGEIRGNEMSGKYHTRGADGSDVDQGTWKVSLVK
ncbi:MAG TPA: hypothetical protein VKY85_11450 [Candidatus Angelobacter sp.]|nr:hypothetical protein [Candidatus Angelobacter sp.]